MDLLSLPDEVILKALEGLSIQDIVNVAAHRRLGASQQPLEPRSAAVFDIYSIRFQDPKAQLPSFRDATAPPTNFFIHDNIIAFQFLTSLFVLLLGTSGVIVEHFELNLGNHETLYTIDYQLTHNGDFLIVASVAVYTGRLTVHEDNIMPGEFGQRIEHCDHSFSLYGSALLTLRDPYLVLATAPDFILIDWRQKTGVRLMRQNPVPSSRNPWNASPGAVSVRIGQVLQTSPIWEIPYTYKHIHGPSSDSHALSTKFEGLKLGIARRRTPSNNRAILPKSFHRWDLDLEFVVSPFNFNPNILMDPGRIVPKDDMINEVNLELSDNTTRTHSLTLSPPFHQDCAMPLKGDWVSSMIFEVRAREHHVSESGVVMVVPKFEDGNGHGCCWVRLGLPAPLKAKLPSREGPNVPVIGWPGAYWSASPCVFDLYTAKMYLWHPDGLHVLQY
ncbi:hypothetical protein SISNIDRAFT_509924 [Sistotremastrum niveocremeum HHB9708]|uniref:F-box domain-containing protein n=1 Tax=Sistotremastrum niveocremeum HHB9708 TaxID=1314777 RepID=A0A164TZZ0_9AGAM|nr:hypothetical protein SISNIDRAFT_509924 [Sistotremastrum niveocremeum HHB9708]